MRRILTVATVALMTLGVLPNNPVLGAKKSKEEVIKGAGSSFVAPIMKKWTEVYKEAKGIKVEYSSVGSGAGVQQLTDKAVDFACSDAPLTDKQREALGQVAQVPLIMGGVVPAYNLEKIEKPLNFTGSILADIYLGKITRWNDEALAKINPGIELPDQEITTVHRADGSGSTFIWSDYLSKVSSDWKEKVGAGTSLKWPVGDGEKGTDGVAKVITGKPGSLGYVELTYALKNAIQYGAVQNRDGNFIQASPASVTAAAEALLKESEDLSGSLVDAAGKDSYPICGTTYAIFPTNPSKVQTKEIMQFLRWVTAEGQEFAKELHYAPLPKELTERMTKKLVLAPTNK